MLTLLLALSVDLVMQHSMSLGAVEKINSSGSYVLGKWLFQFLVFR